MSLQERSQVRASHDIRRFRTTVVAHGSPGRIVALCPGQTDSTYTVEFSPRGVSGATVVLAGLNDRDVGISSDARDDACPGDGADWALAVSGQPGGFGLFTV